MSRRSLALLFLSVAAACGRRPDAALDRDDVTLHPAAGPTGALLDSATKAAARGDTAAAHAWLADAEATADEDPALVYSVAAVGDRLGDGPNAAMGYAHYLALSPDGAYAGRAAERRAALVAGDPAPAIATAPVPTAPVATTPVPTHEVPRAAPSLRRTTAAAGARARVTRRTRSSTSSFAARPSAKRAAAPSRRGMLRATAARPAGAPAVAGPSSSAEVVATTNAGETSRVASTPDSVPTAASTPAARPARARRGKLAAIGAATGALLGAVVGRGAPSAVAGAVLGGAAGAAAGSRNIAPTSDPRRTTLGGHAHTSAGW